MMEYWIGNFFFKIEIGIDDDCRQKAISLSCSWKVAEGINYLSKGLFRDFQVII